MKNNKKLIIILSIINIVFSLIMLIFATPAKVPLLINLKEEIIFTCTKWVYISNIIFPVLLLIIFLITKNKAATFFINSFIVYFLYINSLLFSTFATSKNLTIGCVSELPLSASIFIPLCIFFMIYSIKLKSLPYKSKLGLRFKYSTQTQFLWQQTHMIASSAYFKIFFILLLISMVFIFIKYIIFYIIIFLVIFISVTFYIILSSRTMYKKYMQMKEKQDKLNSKKTTTN